MSTESLALSARDVRMVYRDRGTGERLVALENIDLDIPEGQFVSIVGPSGCGKSTMLKLISGLVRASRGAVRVGGQDVRGPLKSCGMAFQN